MRPDRYPLKYFSHFVPCLISCNFVHASWNHSRISHSKPRISPQRVLQGLWTSHTHTDSWVNSCSRSRRRSSIILISSNNMSWCHISSNMITNIRLVLRPKERTEEGERKREGLCMQLPLYAADTNADADTDADANANRHLSDWH